MPEAAGSRQINVNGNYKKVRNFMRIEKAQGPNKMCKGLRGDQGTMMCREDGGVRSWKQTRA
jgi:hypothetical protein